MDTEITVRNDDWTHPVVLYDGLCPICRDAVRRSRPHLEPRRVIFMPLQAPASRARLGLAEGEVPAEMKLSLPDGTVLGGRQAIAYLLRVVWWSAWLGWLIELPGIRIMSDRAYRWVARNRTCLGDVCALPHVKAPRHHRAITFFEAP